MCVHNGTLNLHDYNKKKQNKSILHVGYEQYKQELSIRQRAQLFSALGGTTKAWILLELTNRKISFTKKIQIMYITK